jgi:hypothetical protein
MADAFADAWLFEFHCYLFIHTMNYLWCYSAKYFTYKNRWKWEKGPKGGHGVLNLGRPLGAAADVGRTHAHAASKWTYWEQFWQNLRDPLDMLLYLSSILRLSITFVLNKSSWKDYPCRHLRSHNRHPYSKLSQTEKYQSSSTTTGPNK